MDLTTGKRDPSIWLFAFGYFAAYVPYSALTKAIASGSLGKLDGVPVPGAQLLAWSTLASLFGMFVFITAMGWWKYAGRGQVFGRSVPMPNRWTFASGVCTSAIILTTTLAYTIPGASIVFMMLLMRGGVLVLAPIVDFISGRHVRWFSATGLVLSLGALVVAYLEDGGFGLSLLATIDVTVYLTAYFIRLRFMSRLAKSSDRRDSLRYFVEEQMTATPVVTVVLVSLALIDHGQFMHDVRAGYTMVFERGIFTEVLLIGLFSQGTGIFGGLVLLGAQENTYCVPVNRASSILAGVAASVSLAIIYDRPALSVHEIIGASLIVGAILVLSIPLLRRARRGG
jgi:hypothetical protein